MEMIAVSEETGQTLGINDWFSKKLVEDTFWSR